MFDTTSVDHAIAIKALESMKNDGRAVLIIAGQKHLGSDPDGKRRQALYNAPKNRAFFKYVYDTYNVTEHFTVDGALYKRQGAAWPIDIIVISGRGKSKLTLPGASAPKTYDSFDDLKTLLNGTPHGATERVLDTEALGLGTSGPALDVGGGDADGAADADGTGVAGRPGSSGPGTDRPGRGGGGNNRPRTGGGERAPAGPDQSEGMGGDAVRGGAGDQTDAQPEQSDVAGAGVDGQPRGGDVAPGSDAGGLAELDQHLSDLDKFDNIFDDALGADAAPGEDLTTPPSENPPPLGQGPVDVAEGKPPVQRTAAEAAKSAVVNTAQGLDDAMDGLAKLFGADPTRLSSGIGFDPETYKKAKPLFIDALGHFKGAALDVKDMVLAFVNYARNVKKWADEVIKRLKPYLKQFITEALNGEVPGFGPKSQRRDNTEVETSFQVRYEPSSKATAVGTLMPVNMRTAVVEALEALVQRQGDVDTFVAKKLGMTVQQVLDGFSAEQVDALALAIDNIEQAKGFIIGDQTGVGKGRFVAGMIKYAITNGITPIFVTKDAKLYGDMFRDTADIGMGDDFKPLMTNNDVAVALDDGRTVRSLANDRNRTVMNAIAKNGNLPEGYNTLMTTYSQLQTIAGKKSARHHAVEALVPGAMIILDESHEAGGTEGAFKVSKDGVVVQSRSEYIRELIAKARGIVYSSATYAKNPHVMSLYFKTDMAEAVEDIKDLAETIKKGGVPLQQVVANMLVKAGQYLRRERSFEGVQFGSKKSDIDMVAYTSMAQRLREIFELDKAMTEARQKYGEYLAQQGEGLGADNAVGDTGVTSATFSSMMHNVIGQSLMALKADAAAQEAIDAWKAGKKPVIALSNTLGSFLDEHVSEHNLKTGSDVTSFSFNQLFMRYLKRTRTVSIKDAYDKNKKTKHYITDGELAEIGFGELVDRFEHVAAQIEGTDLTSVPASPIDHMLEKMRAAGMKVDEITGRQTKVETKNGVKRLATRQATIAEKGRLVNAFNSGDIDGLIINRSGSTGLSIHASSKYKDKKTRRMVLMQADPNIDVFMQMLGRIHRTGQVVPPEYTLLSANVPAERRPAAITAGKMKSLNANTSANSDSAFTDAEALDFMNRYGDEVVANILAEDPELQSILDIRARDQDKSDDAENSNEGIARKVTGRASILTPEEQTELFDRIAADYSAYIARLDSLGENLLVAKTRDLQAVTQKKFVLVPGKGEGSPFVEAAYLERIEMNRMGKPYPLDRIGDMVQEARGQGNGVQKSGADWFKDREAQQRALFDTSTADLFEAEKEARKDLSELLDARREFNYQNGQVAAKKKFGPLVVAAELKQEKATNRVKEAKSLNDLALGYLYTFQPGATVKITIGKDEDAVEFMGIVLDHTYDPVAKNPLALSNSVITVAVADAVRELEIPYSQLANQKYKMEKTDAAAVRSAFGSGLTSSRETRWMITGNLLSGFNTFRKGQMTIYTDEMGSVREGILMAPKFNPEKELDKKATRFDDSTQVMRYLKEAPVSRGIVMSSDGAIMVTRDSAFDYVIKIKPKGGRQYFTNPDVVRIIGDFVQKSGKGFYTAKTSRTDKLQSTLDALALAGETGWQTDQFKDIAKRITGQKTLEEVQVQKPTGMMALRRRIRNNATTEKVTVYDENNNAVLADQYVVPGAEQSPEQKAQAERDRQKAALELMAKQSKMRTGKAQEEPGGLFGDKPKQGTLFARPRNEPFMGTPSGPAILAALTDRLRQMDPTGKLELVVVPEIRRMVDGELFAADGMYLEGLITVALDSESKSWTLDHEIIHGFRDKGFFRSAEWAALVRLVKADTARMQKVDEAYRDAYTEMFPDDFEERIIEEAVADLHADWRAGKVQLNGFPKTAFQRIQDLLRALFEVLTGQGFNTAESVFERLGSGEMGRRTPTGERTFLKATPRFAAAWHGTPHDFDEFDVNKINTGEGAQAFGWGLYFTSKKAIAEHYRNGLSRTRGMKSHKGKVIVGTSGDDVTVIGKDATTAGAGKPINFNGDHDAGVESLIDIALEHNASTRDEVAAALIADTDKAGRLSRWVGRNGAARDLFHRLEDAVGGKWRIANRPGRLFKVELAPTDDEYLLWDKTIDKQPPKVRAALGQLARENGVGVGDLQSGETGRSFYNAIADKLGGVHQLGRDGMRYPVPYPDEKEASMQLKALGVRGIKYLDGMSRSDGDGSFNYVLFDDKDVKVVEKFSLKRTKDAPAFADFSEEKIRSYANVEHYGAYFTRVDARKFIELTTPPDQVPALLEKLPKTSNNQPYDVVSGEFNPDEFDMEQQFAVPFLRVDDTGRIISHEGRHRAAALLRAGARTMPIAILPDYRSEWIKDKQPPKMLLPQNYGAVRGFGTMKLGAVAHVPRRPTDSEVTAAMKIVGPESNPNPPGGPGKGMFGGLRKVESAPTFYSALTKGVEVVTQSKAPAAHWAGIIDSLKAKGVKPAEIEWSGVKEWLAEQKGSVTREQVLEFLRANEVQVEEVVKGGSGTAKVETRRVDGEDRFVVIDPNGREVATFEYEGQAEQEAANYGGARTRDQIETAVLSMLGDTGMHGEQLDMTTDSITDQWMAAGDQSYVLRRLRAYGVPQDDLRRFEEYARQPGNIEYAKWQLPGGQNYRELVLTLPQKAMTAKELPPGYEVKKNSISGGAAWIVAGPGPLGENRYASGVNEEAALQNYWQLHGNDAAFQGGHFKGHKNVLGWVRFNERYTDGPTPENIADIERRLVEAVGAKSASSLASGAPSVAVRKGLVTETEAAIWSKAKGMLSGYENLPGALGKRVLFIEEIQSDWAQKGRREGFKGKPLELKDLEIKRFAPQEAWKFIEEDQGFSTMQNMRDMRRQWINEYGRTNNVLHDAEVTLYRLAGTGTAWSAIWVPGKTDQQILKEARAYNEPYTTIGAENLKRATGAPTGPFVTDTEQWAGLAFKRALRWAAENGFERVAWTPGSVQADRYSLDKQIKSISVNPHDNVREVNIELLGGMPSAVAMDVDKNGMVVNSTQADLPGKPLSEVIGKEMSDRIMGLEEAYTFEGMGLKLDHKGMRGFYDKILPTFVAKYVKKWGAKVGKTKIDTGARKPPTWETTDDGGMGTFEVHSVDVTPAMVESVKQGQPMFALRPAGIMGNNAQARATQNTAHAQTVMPLVQALRNTGPVVPENVRAAVDGWRTGIQDRFLPLLRVQQQIEESLGRPLSDDENAYMREELSYGRKGAKFDDLAEDHVRPLFEDLHARNVTVDELESYLYARHAPERNARISSINPNFAEGEGSGMTDDEAADVMDAVAQSGKMPDLEALAARIDAIHAAALQERIDGGLLSEDEAGAWDAHVRDRVFQQKVRAAASPEDMEAAEKWLAARAGAYEHYIPLRGEAELDPALEAERPRMMGGISVRGPESRRAFGRQSKANDILAYTLMQAQEAILRSETNHVAQAFHQMAVNNPDPELWTINKITTKPVFNKAKGQVEYRSSPRIAAEDADYTVSVKIDGQEHRVTMNRKNPEAKKLAEAMRNLNGQQMNAFVKYFGAIGRAYSTINTTLNYEFVITNAFRDAQTAMVNIQQFDEGALAKQTAKYYIPAVKASTKGAFHNFDGEWGKWYKRFRDVGGKVYFNTIEDLGQQRRKIEQAVADAKPGLSARKAVVEAFRFIQNVNNGVENAVRLAAFRTAVESGMSDEQAASLAKNLTVNFNRHGSYGPMINALYVFFNANVQGTARMLTGMATSARTRKIVGGIVMTGALISMINAMVAGDDDDDESYYDKLSEFDKSKNMIIFYGSGPNDFLKIPMAYGYNAFFNVGRGAVDIARGKKVTDVLTHQLVAFVEAFVPLDNQNLLNAIAPTVADPFVDLTMNRNFADRPIMPDQPAFGDPIPDSQRFFNGVSPISKGITDTLNTATGGDDVVPGGIDVSPETLDYLFGVVTGAMGSSAKRIVDLPFKLADPTVDMEWNDIPLARKLKGEKGPWVDRTAFYERSDEVTDLLENYKDYVRTDRETVAEAYLEDNRAMIELAATGDKIRTALSLMRKLDAAEKKQVKDGTLTTEAYITSRDERRATETEYVTMFNKAYLAAKKGVPPVE